MNFIDEVKGLIDSAKVREASENFLNDAIDSVLGSPMAAAKLLITLGKSPFFIQNELFWNKFSRFLNGVFIDENARSKMAVKIESVGDKKDNAIRLIDAIERSDSLRKVDYLINATRCLLADYIDLTKYFRICRAVSETLLEDLMYLREHISEDKLAYSEEVQGLISAGLMYMSYVGEQPQYSFTPIANDVDKYAISSDDINRYPNPQKAFEEVKQVSVFTSGLKGEVIGETLR